MFEGLRTFLSGSKRVDQTIQKFGVHKQVTDSQDFDHSYETLDVRNSGSFSGAEELQRSRYGNPKYFIGDRSKNHLNYRQIREQARQLASQSTVAGGIEGRVVDTVIATGLTWESNPEWDMIPKAPTDDTKRYKITQNLEGRFRILFNSSELDLTRRQNFNQWMRLAFKLGFREGELFVLVRYYSDARVKRDQRFSPVTLQILNPDQVVNPWGVDFTTITKNGGCVYDGIEYDSDGVPAAIWITVAIGQKPVRVPFEGNERTFVIHWMNIDTSGQSRGLAELEAIAYELNRLSDFDVGEIEAAVSQSAILASVEADVDARPGKGPRIDLAGPKVKDGPGGTPYKPGIETVKVANKSIIFNNMHPGYTLKAFQPTRPNPEYRPFSETLETRCTNIVSMPHSVYSQKFQSSYSASRMESVFYWISVLIRRNDFAASVVEKVRKIIFNEWVRMGELPEVTDYAGSPWVRAAWNQGDWNGIPRPSVDPVKDLEESRGRIELGQSTNERETKNYNGSDYRDNLTKQSSEKKFKENLGLVSEEV